MRKLYFLILQSQKRFKLLFSYHKIGIVTRPDHPSEMTARCSAATRPIATSQLTRPISRMGSCLHWSSPTPRPQQPRTWALCWASSPRCPASRLLCQQWPSMPRRRAAAVTSPTSPACSTLWTMQACSISSCLEFLVWSDLNPRSQIIS